VEDPIAAAGDGLSGLRLVTGRRRADGGLVLTPHPAFWRLVFPLPIAENSGP